MSCSVSCLAKARPLPALSVIYRVDRERLHAEVGPLQVSDLRVVGAFHDATILALGVLASTGWIG